MKDLKRILFTTLLVGPEMGLYSALVFQRLWNWFGAEHLNLSPVSFWQMYGLLLITSTFKTGLEEWQHGVRFTALATTLDACVPPDRQDWVNQQIERQKQGMWGSLALQLVNRACTLTGTLAVGWAIYTFLY